MPFEFAKPAGSRRGLGVLAALLLATAALAGLSIQSVYREAQVRKQFIADTNRSIADLVTARLDAAMADADRSVAAAFESIEHHTPGLLRKIHEVESVQPWLAPLVVISAPLSVSNHVSPAPHFQDLMAAAERAEFQANAPLEASRLYATAFSEAANSTERATALNGQARSELKAGDQARAEQSYSKLAEEADTLDREQLRLAVIAKERLMECCGLLKKEFYDFLADRRFLLDPETYSFYRKKLEIGASTREQQLDLIAQKVEGAQIRATPIANTDVKVAHVWTAANVRLLLDRLLAEPGPWSEVSIELTDDSGHWRITASPKSGSVEALASREVLRFGLLLGLVFATVVIAMFLAARSVSRELALSRMRSEFVASVSHELKTPLALIRMFAESLREGWVSEQKRPEYYEVITRESERLTGLINNVLDFSRIESGTRKYQPATMELGGIIRGLLERYRYHLNAANIELIEELAPEPVEAFVDAEAIEQVVVNLLSNAVKYMGDTDGRPRAITVSLRGRASEAVIGIADTGMGMSEQDRLKIFERFWRSEDAHVRAVAGSGLGLTLVKHIVDAHDGSISVESVLGKGSTFAITLPLNAGGRS